MEELYINVDWTFKEVVENIEALKSQVRDIVASFSCFQSKERILFKRNLRKTIYSFKFEQWKRERILECIYGDFEIEKLQKMI